MIFNQTEQSCSRHFQWHNPPTFYKEANQELTIVPQGESDCIRSFNSTIADSASFLFTAVSGDFTIQAKLTCELPGKFDAGALMIRENEQQWAKICIEKCADGGLSIVSVVTKEWSDDTNNEVLTQASAFLRITRKGDMIGMHYSLDGKCWRFVRKFGVNWADTLQIGVAAQAPKQAGCQVQVQMLQLQRQPVMDFRSGE